jgi:hypothetical protein
VPAARESETGEADAEKGKRGGFRDLDLLRESPYLTARELRVVNVYVSVPDIHPAINAASAPAAVPPPKVRKVLV